VKNDSTGTEGRLKTLLLAVTRNVTTDSPWPISSNPEAYYNDPKRRDSNLNMKLWQLVRASTAAPIYFPPEVIECDPTDPKKSFVFVDGGVTPYNNPAFLLYRFATDPAYNLNWDTAEDQLLLISVGTGAAPDLGATADDHESNMLATGAAWPDRRQPEQRYGVRRDGRKQRARQAGSLVIDRRVGTKSVHRARGQNAEAV